MNMTDKTDTIETEHIQRATKSDGNKENVVFFRLDSECTLGFNNICRLLYHHPIEVQESQREAIFRWSNFTKRSSEVA